MMNEWEEKAMSESLASFHALPFICDVFGEDGEWLFEGRTTGESVKGQIYVYATVDKLSQAVLQRPNLFHDGDYLLWARGPAELVKIRVLPEAQS